jgi:hypothetical protein
MALAHLPLGRFLGLAARPVLDPHACFGPRVPYDPNDQSHNCDYRHNGDDNPHPISLRFEERFAQVSSARAIVDETSKGVAEVRGKPGLAPLRDVAGETAAS